MNDRRCINIGKVGRDEVYRYVEAHPACRIGAISSALGVSRIAAAVAVSRLRESGLLDPAYALVPWDASAIMPGFMPRGDLGDLTYGMYGFAADVGGTLDDYAKATGAGVYACRASAQILRQRRALLPFDSVLTTEQASSLRDAAWSSLRSLERALKAAA